MIPNGQIRKNPFSGAKLWVMKKKYNSQLHVVLALWEKGLII